MDIKEAHNTDLDNHLQVYKRFPITLVEGKGSKVWDNNGKEYIDALAGIAVNSIGHCHPRLVNAIKTQSEKLLHVSNFFTSPPQAELAELLVELSGMDRVFFNNSGGEAVETAFKLARKWGSKNNKSGEIISMKNCFHGRTIGTIAAGKKKYQDGFEPMPPGYKQVEYNDIESLKEHINHRTTAVALEPIQGEGGIHPADKEYLKQVRELCDQHDCLLIFDEVQCGVGRVGTFYAWQHYDVKPDIISSAKALGGGVPIGATLCTQKVDDAIGFGEHGTTYGGNPLVTAAALENIKVILDENLMDKAKEHGEKIRAKFNVLAERYSEIKEVRGLGMMIGVELNMPGKELVMKMLEKGVIANCTADTVIRLVPPLNISKEDMDKVIDTFEESLKELINE